MDLEFFRNQKEEPDMSPQAITQRMEALSQLCNLSVKLNLPDILYVQSDSQKRPGRYN